MCPGSAKVQLNMGITERRYYNWDVALEHFEAAHALATPGFCEPLYWLGVTRINAGHDIGRGAQVPHPPAWPVAERMNCLVFWFCDLGVFRLNFCAYAPSPGHILTCVRCKHAPLVHLHPAG